MPVRIPLGVTNRHGLVAGATGTGKTKTLQLMAEQVVTSGAFTSMLRSAGTVLGGEITRSIFGTARLRR